MSERLTQRETRRTIKIVTLKPNTSQVIVKSWHGNKINLFFALCCIQVTCKVNYVEYIWDDFTAFNWREKEICLVWGLLNGVCFRSAVDSGGHCLDKIFWSLIGCPENSQATDSIWLTKVILYAAFDWSQGIDFSSIGLARSTRDCARLLWRMACFWLYKHSEVCVAGQAVKLIVLEFLLTVIVMPCTIQLCVVRLKRIVK